jgi:hypothetical protein
VRELSSGSGDDGHALDCVKRRGSTKIPMSWYCWVSALTEKDRRNVRWPLL